ncbi:ABC transporter substrate-binding protein [Clostridia bacterium]|nr:ABC transporter substrate-binding protein [Clostridia bacterium]
MGKLAKILSLAMAGCMLASVAAGCTKTDDTSKPDDTSSTASTTEVKEIYFLNFKPENGDKYKAIATKYEEETGIKVKVETAAEGKYEETLTAEVDKSNPPTIFQINGPVGYSNWKEYCADLKDTKLYDLLNDKSLAVTGANGEVVGVPYTVEGYGIIYNNAIFDKYFASDKKTSAIKSVDEINNFAKLKEVVEDMTKIKADLGIDGVFASTSLKPGEDWRWQTHLANLPFYYEFKGTESTITKALDAKTIEFKYAENFKNIFDLYTNNSTTAKNLLGSKTVDDSMAEIALGKAAMVQNGFWGWGQIDGVEGNTVKAEDIKFLPIYTGVDGEESQGLCIGTENYFAINSQVDEATQKASADFLEWLFTSEYGKDQAINQLDLNPPFTSFGANETPSNPLAKEMLAWMAKDGVTSVEWTFNGFPSQTWKDNLGAGLLSYVQDQKTWDELVTATIEDWKVEREKAAVE